MAEIALRMVALSKRFGGLAAVSDVSLDFAVGEIHAVIGPNGAGKSTLVNLLSGDFKPTSGDIFLSEANVTRLGADKRGLLGIGRSYQKTTIFPDATVFENVRLAVQAHAPAAVALMARAINELALRTRTDAALSTAGLSARAGIRANTLSHGEQRQLEIAMVIATDPKVVLLDEPLAGMSGSESRDMVALIKTLRHGRAVLLVEHDMDAVFAVADKLTVMADGKVIASGAPEDVRRHPAVRTAYLGAETLHT
ncbi:MAG: branched-chain amino acid transport system ATP-binding protein [Hyphomicrobiales bacterium]|jgi:branched-chain amino acid transport system ATP-binding protein